MPLFYPRFGRPGLLGLAARTAVVAGTATAVGGGILRHQQNRAVEDQQQRAYETQQQQAQIDQAAADAVREQRSAAPQPDLIGELQKLDTLHDQGTLSDTEFDAAKAKLLA